MKRAWRALIGIPLIVQCDGVPAWSVWVKKRLASGSQLTWDAYVGLGTLLFPLSMLRHPRFGRVFAGSGIAIALLLLALNMYTFPEPLDRSGFFDVGPAIGMWYLAVSIQGWRSIAWARSAVAA
ncbi:MAG TPA: hypothetical protein VES67_25990 [Vicinamibacterales bacterium]|nr:hypothetical protein [Vicinamibacterales bacterium]